MYATANKKMLNMLILDILKEYSDADHRLTQQEIIRLLKSNYDMECDRRSVKNNVLYLKELGYEISMDDGYYLVEREFDDAELRMLIDSVLFSKQLTQKQTKDLIEKLRKLGSRYFSAKVSHISNLPDLQHADNKQLMYALDAVNDAITEKKKISFIYNSYGIDFKLHPRREEPYIVSPYQMVANNGHFYLIGNYDKYDNIVHFRLDKMTCVKILNEKVKSQREIKDFEQGFSLPKHMAEHIYMFSGPSVRVKLLAKSDMMNELIDWLGKDFTVRQTDNEEEVIISLYCNEKSMVYWALQYGPYVEVLEPEHLRKRIAMYIKEMNEKYDN
ncbi:MAG: WYL domain-containing protein [Lachnospiraceae bacterium]|nr:WYL domain-containing protein [Lachnospiraceae bacterium]